MTTVVFTCFCCAVLSFVSICCTIAKLWRSLSGLGAAFRCNVFYLSLLKFRRLGRTKQKQLMIFGIIHVWPWKSLWCVEDCVIFSPSAYTDNSSDTFNAIMTALLVTFVNCILTVVTRKGGLLWWGYDNNIRFKEGYHMFHACRTPVCLYITDVYISVMKWIFVDEYFLVI